MAGETTTTTTTADTTAAAGGGAATPWYEGHADAETVGYLQNRGLHLKTPVEAALDLSKAHREAQKLIGGDEKNILRLPTDPKDEAGWKTVWSRLGAPAEAKDYDFSAIKMADGTALNDSLAEAIRAQALSLHLPKDAAASMAQSFAKYLDGVSTAKNADLTAALQGEKTALKTNWGPNHDTNMLVARNAAAALKLTGEEISALEKTVGYARTMEMFRAIGSKIGEDKFIGNSSGAGQGGAVTREQAVARKTELMADKGWVAKYMAGDVANGREMSNLIAIIVGGDDQ